MSAPPRRIAYIVSRFPVTSETFIVRELNEVVRAGEFDVTLMSLFPAPNQLLHPEAERWAAEHVRPGLATALGALAGWVFRRPLRTAGALAAIIAATWREPSVMLKSLTTVPLAAAHARTVRERRIEHVHAHYASLPALSAWICGRLCDVPYSFTAHAHDIFTTQAMLERKIRDAEFVVTISEFNRRFLAEHGGDRPAPVHVVHCGVVPGAYPFHQRPRPIDRPVRALTVATLQEKKGHSVLLDALASGPALDRVSVDLVGGGELRGELERRSQELGLAERVRFHGPRTEEEVRQMLAAADLFVLPSVVARDGQMEGLPVALIEAVASGLPVVATRLSGVPELIVEGETGALAEPGDPQSLVAAILRVIDGPSLDPAAGRRLIESEFDVRVSGERMRELLRPNRGLARDRLRL